ncbi:MAG: type II toxin-antitoxin system VapC family toxin [Deltaproteobacteria bacterium]|nr:type II toxin-antitoxin system VapC family toxin [Deltaproteobacteria bacterium]
MNRPVCIDASVVLKLVVVEADSEQAVALWTALAERGHSAVAPALLLFECVSSLRRLVQQERMRASAARLALDRLLTLPIGFPTPDGLVDRAWQLAAHYRQPQAYDSFYLALADLLNVPFWTADRHLYKALNGELGWVRLLGRDTVDAA